MRGKNLGAIGEKVDLVSNHFAISLPAALNKVVVYKVQVCGEDGVHLAGDDRRRIQAAVRSVERELKKSLGVFYVSLIVRGRVLLSTRGRTCGLQMSWQVGARCLRHR